MRQIAAILHRQAGLKRGPGIEPAGTNALACCHRISLMDLAAADCVIGAIDKPGPSVAKGLAYGF